MKFAIPLPTIAVAILLLSHVGSRRASAQDGADGRPQLHFNQQADTLLFRLSGRPVGEDGPWVLQWSAGLNQWEDLAFFGKPAGAGEGDLELELSSRSIPQQGRAQQFFRARYLDADDPLLREFLAARDTWRRSGIRSYTIEVRWQVSFLFWHGTVTVRAHEVTAVEVIDTNFFEPPEPRTIDDWFDHLKSFIDNKADRIDATYDAVFGYPESVAIDENFMIADEEQSWSILDFLPHR